MPKMKISKTVSGRFKVTPTGKVMRRKSGHRHLITAKSKANSRRAKVPVNVFGKTRIKLKKMLGF